MGNQESLYLVWRRQFRSHRHDVATLRLQNRRRPIALMQKITRSQSSLALAKVGDGVNVREHQIRTLHMPVREDGDHAGCGVKSTAIQGKCSNVRSFELLAFSHPSGAAVARSTRALRGSTTAAIRLQERPEPEPTTKVFQLPF